MSKDLTTSIIDRKNILNNNVAIQEIYEQVGFHGLKFEGKYRFTKQQLAGYFEVDIRTIDRLLENHKTELEQSGYELLTGTALKRFKEEIAVFLENAKARGDVHDMAVVDMIHSLENEVISLSKAPSLGVFTYKSFLNIGMLLTSSDKAQKQVTKNQNKLDDFDLFYYPFSGKLSVRNWIKTNTSRFNILIPDIYNGYFGNFVKAFFSLKFNPGFKG